MKEQYLYEDDFARFRQWLSFDLEEVTWQGSYREDFDLFWHQFFLDGLSLPQVADRFSYALRKAKTGPIQAWFSWLKVRLIIFCYINIDQSIQQLAEQFKMRPKEVGFFLRDFFIEKFPEYEEELGQVLQVNTILSPSLSLKFEDIATRLQLTGYFDGKVPNDVMPTLEVTLYRDWHRFLKAMRKDLLHKDIDIKKIEGQESVRKYKRFVRDFALFSLAGTSLLAGIIAFNEKLEQSLIENIALYEPQFSWLDQTLKFQENKEEKDEDIVFNLKDLEEIENIEANEQQGQETKREIFTTESDVMVTSVDQLPRDFDRAGLEQSNYEEEKKGGYRDNTRYGRKKVYRVLVESSDPDELASQVTGLVDQYGAQAIGNVKPGTPVPGGIYYNLYVPTARLKEFLTYVVEISGASLYENKSRGRGPRGKNKVFIWIKAI